MRTPALRLVRDDGLLAEQRGVLGCKCAELHAQTALLTKQVMKGRPCLKQRTARASNTPLLRNASIFLGSCLFPL